MCDQWHYEAEIFVAWCLARGWTPELEVDRYPDQNGPYSPENCRLVSHKENCRNKTNNYLLTAFGETKCLAAWLEDPRCIVKEGGLRHRLFIKGMAPELALTAPHEHSHLATLHATFSTYGRRH